MGKTKIVNSDFWTDEIVEDFTPEDKLFWLFLLTNPKATTIGIYEITVKQAAYWLGYSNDSVRCLLDRFENKYGLIRVLDNEVAIRNYLRYSVTRGGKPVADALRGEMKKVKHGELIVWVFESVYGRKDLSPTVTEVIDEYCEENNVVLGEDTQSPPIPPSIYNNINNNKNIGVGVGGDTGAYRGTIRGTIRDTNRGAEATPFISLSLNDNTEYPVWEEDVAEYESLYPAVDVRQALRSMKAWLNSNPKNRKTKGGIKRFINGWLAKEQNGYHPKTSGAKKQSKYEEIDTWQI